jgi:hypothetical protein
MIAEFEPEQALATLPLLVCDPSERARAMEDCDFVVGDPADMSAETRDLYERMRRLLDFPSSPAPRAQAWEPERS